MLPAVSFLNPWVLWLLPLALAPLVWYWNRRRQAAVLELPSLFLLKRVLSRSKGRPAPPWLEVLLEISFLAALLLAFAHPVHRSFGPAIRRLAIFADTSPSLESSYPAWRNALRKAARTWTESRPGAEISWSDWTHVREKLPPTPIDSEDSLSRIFDALVTDNGRPNFDEAAAHFEAWPAEYLAEDCAILLVSDFNVRRFRSGSRITRGRHLALALGEPSPATAILPAPPRSGLSFPGEQGALPFRLSRRGPPVELTVRVLDRQGSTRYVATHALAGDGSMERTVSLPLSSSGLLPLEFRLEENGVEIERAFSVVRVQAPLPLSLVPAQGEIGRFLSAVFRRDVERGNLIPDASADTALIAAWKRPEELAARRGKPTTVFLPSGLAAADVEEGLARWLGADVKVRKEKRSSGERPAACVRRPDAARLPPELAALAHMPGWDELRFSAWYQLEPGPKAQVVLELDDGSPLLIRSGSAWIFAVDPAPAASGLSRSPLSVPLLTLTVLASQPLPPAQFVSAEEAASAGAPLMEDRRRRLLHPLGLFSNAQGFTVVNEAPEERIGPFVAPSAHFALVTRVRPDELGRGEFRRGMPGLRQLLLLVAFAAMLGLGMIALRRARVGVGSA